MIQQAATNADSFGISEGVILVAAVIGVGGSFALYGVREYHRTVRLRLALREELSAVAETLYITALRMNGTNNSDLQVPYNFLASTIYSTTAGDLARLSDAEVNSVVAYYTLAAQVQEQITTLQAVTDPAERELVLLRRQITELHNRRVAALIELDSRCHLHSSHTGIEHEQLEHSGPSLADYLEEWSDA